MTIRANVEFILKAKKMNKAELCEKTKYSPSGLTRYLDEPNIGLVAIRRIAKALGVKPADLIATPPLSEKNPYTNYEEKLPGEPCVTSFVCPSCGNKMKITIEEV